MGHLSRDAIFSRRHGPPPGQCPPPLPLPQPDCVRVATLRDLRFVDHLQRRYANCVGFLPRIAIENLLEAGHMRLATENDDGAGYILSRPRLQWQPRMRSITQACVAMDAQRRHHGLALLTQIAAEAAGSGIVALQACCAVGLDSNSFWRAAGFVPICHMRPDNVRGREVICWRKPLTSVVPTWFAMPPRFAGHRAAKPNTTRDPNRSMDAVSDARSFIV